MHQLLSLLTLQLSITSFVQSQVPLSELYPYGASAQDLALPRIDDASTPVPIQFDFPFFDSTYRVVHISTNGQLNFGSGDGGFVPRPFPLTGYRSVASYWTDSDPSKGGNVFYRESEVPSLLNRITEDVRSRFVEHRSFTSRWALVVTFDRVAAYGCTTGTPSGCATRCSDTLTYQTVLTSNGIQSFAIFYFNTLRYTVGTAACTAHAQVGFNAGDGKRFFVLPSSNSAGIAQVALTNSNIGVPGKWMFTIDGSDISEGCNARGLLEIYPRKMLYFGNHEITISGPCMSNLQTEVNVTFGNIEIKCNVTQTQQVQCVAPLFSKLGNNEVTLVYNNITYRSFVSIVDMNDKICGHGHVATKETGDPNENFSIRWNASAACGSNGYITLKGFQIDYILDVTGDILREEAEPLDYGEVPNSGSYEIRPKYINREPTISFIRKISLAGYCTGSDHLIPIARKIYFGSRALGIRHCIYWHGQQPSATGISDIVDEVSRRNPCPPGVAADFPLINGNFALDESCNPSDADSCAFYHPNAKACYRSTSNVSQRVTQCCYDSSLRLILGPPHGGALTFADPSVSLTSYFRQDVIPFMTCCKFGNITCGEYYEKRPSIDSRFFQPPATGNGGGDPHFTTLDGTSYTFNPVGEFTYLETGDDVIQARITQFVDSSGNRKLACYFAAFAIKSGESDTVQVELSSVKQFSFRVNGQTVTLESGLWRFDGISVNYINNSTVVIQVTSGITLEIQIIGGVFGAIVQLPGSAKGQVNGLIGNWDDDTENDFQLPNGTHIPINSSSSDIHAKFGMTWSTDANSSLFTYPTGLAWSDYQNRIFIPSFATPPDNPQCQGDSDCNYDASVTGDISVGLSNIAVKQRAAEIVRINEEVSTYCPATVGVANGQVTVEESGSSTSYSVECDTGFTLKGKQKVTCVSGNYDAIGVCVSAEDDTQTTLMANSSEEPDRSSAYKTPPRTSALITIVLAASVLRYLMQFG